MPRYYHEFFLGRDNGWWELADDDTNRIYNFNGGYHYHEVQPEDEIVEAESFDDLNWATVFIKPNSKYGWLSPAGTWYPCDKYDHRYVARFIFKKDEWQLEDDGFVKLFDEGLGEVGWYCENVLTSPQYEFLVEHGFDKEEIDFRNRINRRHDL